MLIFVLNIHEIYLRLLMQFDKLILTCLVLNLGNDGSSCSFKLNPDGTFIGNWFWGATEDWCSFDCLKYNSAQDRKFNFYHLLMAVAITLQAKIVGW